MRQWFDTTASSRKSLAAIAREKFGEEGGILQMFLFHAARVGLIDSPDGKAIG